jgi:DNA gyrase subunit A
LRVIGRTTQGVRLINLDDGDTLVSATTVAREDDDVEATQDGDIEGRAAPDIEASEHDAAEALQDGDGKAPDAE